VGNPGSGNKKQDFMICEPEKGVGESITTIQGGLKRSSVGCIIEIEGSSGQDFLRKPTQSRNDGWVAKRSKGGFWFGEKRTQGMKDGRRSDEDGGGFWFPAGL